MQIMPLIGEPCLGFPTQDFESTFPIRFFLASQRCDLEERKIWGKKKNPETSNSQPVMCKIKDFFFSHSELAARCVFTPTLFPRYFSLHRAFVD